MHLTQNGSIGFDPQPHAGKCGIYFFTPPFRLKSHGISQVKKKKSRRLPSGGRIQTCLWGGRCWGEAFPTKKFAERFHASVKSLTEASDWPLSPISERLRVCLSLPNKTWRSINGLTCKRPSRGRETAVPSASSKYRGLPPGPPLKITHFKPSCLCKQVMSTAGKGERNYLGKLPEKDLPPG